MKNGVKNRGNGQGCAIRVRANSYKAVAVIGYRDNDPSKPIRRTKSGFATKAEALAYIPILKKQIKKPKATLATLYKPWSESAMLKLSKNQQQRMSYAKNRLIDIWNIDITIISIEDLQDIVNKKTSTYYPAKDMKTLLSHLYDRAVAQQYVTTNLAKFIELPPLEETEQTPFNDNEIKAFWKDYGDGNLFTGYIILMIYSGMMPGELMECTKDLIDWDKQTIFGCGLKTKKRRSTPIVVADIVLPVLRELAASSPDERLLPYSKKQFYKLYDETIARCGVRQLPPYSCRHTTATVLTNIEDNIAVVKEVMRHSKYQTTQRYIHLNTVPMLNAVNKIGESETAKD